ncbi:MAG: hypothetical protein I8H66_12540 [Sphingobacteriia bacterium]|nr:hypothetical protein [Sphingobacteriia bacterium]
MKKVIICLAFVLGCSMSSLMAQPPGGGQQMSPEQRAAMMKERLKPLALTDVQADSVVAVFSDRSLMGNMRDMTPEERQAKMKEAGEARQKRLEKTLGADLTKKVMELMSQRPGGGPRGGGR